VLNAASPMRGLASVRNHLVIMMTMRYS